MEGTILTPTKKMLIDCYVDMDVYGLYGYYDPQYPIYAEVITIYAVSFI